MKGWLLQRGWSLAQTTAGFRGALAGVATGMLVGTSLCGLINLTFFGAGYIAPRPAEAYLRAKDHLHWSLTPDGALEIAYRESRGMQRPSDAK